MQHVTIDMGNLGGPEQIAPALKILLLFTVLSLAPAILVSMTSFTRIVIVMSFVRQAVGSQNLPPAQVIMSLLLTFGVMGPVAQRVNHEAVQPYQEMRIDEKEAFERASQVMRGFLIPQTRKSDLMLFYELTKAPAPKDSAEVSLHLLVPAFMISELRTGFEMGFL